MAPTKKSRTKNPVKKDRRIRKKKEKEPKPVKVKKERKRKETYVQRKFRERISRSGMKAGSLLNYFPMSKIVKGENKKELESDEDENSQPLPLSKLPEDIASSATTNLNEEEMSTNPLQISNPLPTPANDHEPAEHEQFVIDETNINSFLKIEIGETFSSFSLPSSELNQEEVDYEYDQDINNKENPIDQLATLKNETIACPKFELGENYSQEDNKYLIQIAKNIFEDSQSQQQVIKEEDNKSFMKSEKKNIVIPDIYK